MKNLIKMMKPGDLIIVGLLVILSFLPLAIFTYQSNATATGDELYVVISADGEVLHEMELKNDHTREVYTYESPDGHVNVVAREGQSVYMLEANCPDALCLQQGEIHEVGDTIVCLPHRVLVEIVSDRADVEDESEIDVIS